MGVEEHPIMKFVCTRWNKYTLMALEEMEVPVEVGEKEGSDPYNPSGTAEGVEVMEETERT